MQTLLLSQSDLQQVLPMGAVIEAVEAAFRAFGRGESCMPSKVYLPLLEGGGDFRAMPAYLEGAAGIKWVNSHPDNPARHGLPTVMALYILSDPQTALPLAVLDATLLTALRTGAAGAIASRALANKPPRTLGLIGCGVQARTLLEAHRQLFADLQVKAADASAAAAQRFASETGATAVTAAEAAACDIVCTATPGRTPVLERAWLRPGVHINAMGADAPGKQELAADVLQHASIFVDDLEQASESGEVNVPLHRGVLQSSDIRGTLSDVLLGRHARREVAEITVFDSTGLAIQDLAVASAAFRLATQRGVGTAFAFTDYARTLA